MFLGDLDAPDAMQRQRGYAETLVSAGLAGRSERILTDLIVRETCGG